MSQPLVVCGVMRQHVRTETNVDHTVRQMWPTPMELPLSSLAFFYTTSTPPMIQLIILRIPEPVKLHVD